MINEMTKIKILHSCWIFIHFQVAFAQNGYGGTYNDGNLYNPHYESHYNPRFDLEYPIPDYLPPRPNPNRLPANQYIGQDGVSRKRTTILDAVGVNWGDWTPWSLCSRSCGEGVRMRSRQCHGRTDSSHYSPKSSQYSSYRSNLCIGNDIDYMVCMGQPCPGEAGDLRETQCTAHDFDVYEDYTSYKWKPYFTEDVTVSPCDVLCIADHLDLVDNFGMAMDGTSCGPDQADVCIAGECRVVGCDGIVESNLFFDVCGVCGGDNSTCYYFHEVFQRFNDGHARSFDYNHVAKIPAGSTEITIEETTKNYLVLSEAIGDYVSYVINGNWLVSWPGAFEIAQSYAMYERDGDKEVIRIPGPTSNDILVMLLYLGSEPLVEYEYFVPKHDLHAAYGELRQEISKIEIPKEFGADGDIQNSPNINLVSTTTSTLPPTTTRSTRLSTFATTTTRGATLPPVTTTTTPKIKPTTTPVTTLPVTTTTPFSCRNCRKPKRRKRHYCTSDFVIRAKIVNRKRFNHGENIRYGVEVKTIYKSTNQLMDREFIWVPSSCCPKLRRNKEYLLMGTLTKTKVGRKSSYETFRLQVSYKNYWNAWKSSHVNKMKRLARKVKCRNYNTKKGN